MKKASFADIFQNFMTFTGLLIASSISACLAAGYLLETYIQIKVCLFDDHYYRHGCDLNNVSDLLFGFIPSATVLGLVFVVMGHAFAFPALCFVYLPISLALWNSRFRTLFAFIVTGTLGATLNGIAFAVLSNRVEGISFVVLFAITGFLTSISHFFLLLRFYNPDRTENLIE